jgi:hypothetical protein
MKKMFRPLRYWIAALLALAVGAVAAAQQPDPSFRPGVSNPAYSKKGPKVLFDEAHNNSHTAGGTYKAFVDLLTGDGYKVAANRQKFSKESLKGHDVLVIANAAGPPSRRDSPAFTDEECDAVRDWVSGGGALLLVAGHRPYGAAAAALASRFGVDITPGHTIDKVNYNKEAEDETELVFSRDSNLIADHAITRGRDTTERINRVLTFSGTSVKGDEKSVVLLKLGDSAFDVLRPDPVPGAREPVPGVDITAPPDYKVAAAAGRGQAVALEFGRGRVVVFAEPSALTAQVTTKGLRYGLSMSGVDNQQLALNIMRWLSGLLK